MFAPLVTKEGVDKQPRHIRHGNMSPSSLDTVVNNHDEKRLG